MIIRNNKGFTAVELMIGIGLAAVLTTAIVSTQLMVSRDQVKMSKDLEQSIDKNMAERIVFSDLNGIDPSYNNVLQKDDSGRYFFDYYPDVPANVITDGLERKITLKVTGTQEIYIVVSDLKAGPLLNYDPVKAYNVGAAPADFNQAASLQFVSLNKNNFLTDPGQSNRSAMWQSGKILMLDTPARIRPLVNGTVNMKIAPRSPIFVGSVQGVNLLSDSMIQKVLNLKHPETGVVIANADQFLRNVPSIGGGQSIIRLKGVKIIKYSLKKYEDGRYKTTPAYLYKSEYVGSGVWSEPFLLSDGVAEFSLRRESVLKRMIYFNIKKAEFKDQALTSNSAQSK
ncbi:type II secretion system protein [Bdellovibrio reynosensis]|uniref:Type II secretion system GspH family protein n=1 Tax=Bdellovibrio reynosensis TaxID=2835041 RepID=A0ABY4CAD4_9BACT|nr:type II secretion system protein [Bdellovibrio reynosensis]UOF01818.1 type II secretion system GspH family protein [Bdellovibrio reynosensis]